MLSPKLAVFITPIRWFNADDVEKYKYLIK